MEVSMLYAPPPPPPPGESSCEPPPPPPPPPHTSTCTEVTPAGAVQVVEELKVSVVAKTKTGHKKSSVKKNPASEKFWIFKYLKNFCRFFGIIFLHFSIKTKNVLLRICG